MPPALLSRHTVCCPMYHGGVKTTTDGRWVHLACAVWQDGIDIESVETMEPLQITWPAATCEPCEPCDPSAPSSSASLSFSSSSSTTTTTAMTAPSQSAAPVAVTAADGSAVNKSESAPLQIKAEEEKKPAKKEERKKARCDICGVRGGFLISCCGPKRKFKSGRGWLEPKKKEKSKDGAVKKEGPDAEADEDEDEEDEDCEGGCNVKLHALCGWFQGYCMVVRSAKQPLRDGPKPRRRKKKEDADDASVAEGTALVATSSKMDVEDDFDFEDDDSDEDEDGSSAFLSAENFIRKSKSSFAFSAKEGTLSGSVFFTGGGQDTDNNDDVSAFPFGLRREAYCPKCVPPEFAEGSKLAGGGYGVRSVEQQRTIRAKYRLPVAPPKASKSKGAREGKGSRKGSRKVGAAAAAAAAAAAVAAAGRRRGPGGMGGRPAWAARGSQGHRWPRGWRRGGSCSGAPAAGASAASPAAAPPKCAFTR